MINNKFNDGMEDLQELLAEYGDKEEQTKSKLKQTKKSLKVKSSKIDKNASVVPMDKVLFGDKAGLIKNLALSVGEIQAGGCFNENSTDKKVKRKAVWIDADDELKIEDTTDSSKYNKHFRGNKRYQSLLKSQYTRIVPQPKWANLDLQNTIINDHSDDEELLGTVGFLSRQKTGFKISPSFISYKPVRDLNRASYAEGCVTSVQFHPKTSAALVAGESGVASIYAIDGNQNEKLHNIYFEYFPISCSRITPCGTRALISGSKHHYFSYDLMVGKETRCNLMQKIKFINRFDMSPCGRYLAFPTLFGQWHWFDAMSNELIHTFQQENPVANVYFADSNRIICTSTTSNVYIYSLKQRVLEHKFFDDGCVKGNVLDLSPNQHLLATGSLEGAVNVYDYASVLRSSTPKPEKTFLNLKTGISSVKFNHTSELLAMSSGVASSAVRIVHCPSGTVYTNFPKDKDEIGKIGTIEFSPQSGYLAMGGKEKKVKLFRIKHYKKY